MPFDGDAFPLPVIGIPRSLGSPAFRVSEDKDDTHFCLVLDCLQSALGHISPDVYEG